MPFRHVVMFRWADHVDLDHVARVRDALDALPGQIDQIRSYVHGADVGVAEGNFDYVVVADFDRVDDWRVYRDHPAHVLLIEELLTGHLADRAVVQYQTPGGASPHDASSAAVQGYLAEPDPLAPAALADLSDDDLLALARKVAQQGMDATLAEPDA